MAADPPEGFEYVSRAPFVNHVGPVYQGLGDPPGTIRLGLRVAQLHTNSFGLLHGGLISTMVDSAMARALHSMLGRRAVTLKMTMEFFEAIHLGDWAVAEGRLTSSDADIALTDCRVRVGDQTRARATGVFRLLKPR
jgi:uncharacterized protein (TIGR00369 family)